MNYNFKTPSGLKVRLDSRYMMNLIKDEHKQYSFDDAVKDTDMNNCVYTIEEVYATPLIFVFIYSIIVTIFFNGISPVVHCLCGIAIYFLAYILALLPFNRFTNILSIPARMFLIIPCFSIIKTLAVVVVAILCKHPMFIVYYIIISASDLILDTFFNHLVLNYTKKKYGYAFGDTEVCAMRIFAYCRDKKDKAKATDNTKELEKMFNIKRNTYKSFMTLYSMYINSQTYETYQKDMNMK